jgi:hypothetical protein
MAISKDDFKAAARKKEAELKQAFTDEPILRFWVLGHSFDTVLDYFLTTDKSDASAFGILARDRYNEAKNSGNDYWWDDYGWWGIATVKAVTSKLFGGDEIIFRTFAFECWTEINKAPDVWQRAKANPQYKPYEPRFDGGVWNHDFDSGCNPGSGGDDLCGRQNTVTNGLYWLLAQRLYFEQQNVDYRRFADREFKFLNAWCNFKTPDLALLNYYGNTKEKVIVRERVSTFLAGGEDADYRRDLAWAGDQGLFLGGLVDRMRILGKGSPEYPGLLNIARGLLAGSRDYLTDPQTGILRSWRPDPAPGRGDVGDYSTGIGVYMRYLLSVYQNDDLKADLKQRAFQDFLRANAENVVNQPSDNGLENLTNDLATLVAAIVILD